MLNVLQAPEWDSAANLLLPDHRVAILRESSLPWAGTFHAIGARLLRELAPVIGLPADYTIHDRSDSADLMGLARQELGLGAAANRFSTKATRVNIYSRFRDEAIDPNSVEGDVAEGLGAMFLPSDPRLRRIIKRGMS